MNKLLPDLIWTTVHHPVENPFLAHHRERNFDENRPKNTNPEQFAIFNFEIIFFHFSCWKPPLPDWFSLKNNRETDFQFFRPTYVSNSNKIVYRISRRDTAVFTDFRCLFTVFSNNFFDFFEFWMIKKKPLENCYRSGPVTGNRTGFRRFSRCFVIRGLDTWQAFISRQLDLLSAINRSDSLCSCYSNIFPMSVPFDIVVPVRQCGQTLWLVPSHLLSGGITESRTAVILFISDCLFLQASKCATFYSTFLWSLSALMSLMS